MGRHSTHARTTALVTFAPIRVGKHPAGNGSARLMFLGRYSHNLDSKGRVAVPARFREPLAEGLVLTRGIDRCLALYPMAVWRPLAERVSALPLSDPNARHFRRMVFAEAVDLELDSQGRILVPPELRRYAGLEREAIVVGVNTSIEIWSPAQWQAVNDVMERDSEEIAQALADLI
jgi:MraZ protein